MEDQPTTDQPTPTPDPPPAPTNTQKPNLKNDYLARVLELHNTGLGGTAIAKQLNLNVSTVGTWIMQHNHRRLLAERVNQQALAGEALNPGNALHHTQLKALKRGLQANQSDDDELADIYRSARIDAVKTLARSARGSKVEGSSITSAKEILKQQPVKPREQLSQLSVSKIEELAERSLVCACSMMGVEAVQKLLDDLKAANQLSVL